ncbi:MAG: M1 family metallopeptidase [Terracidiphilus sp.]
MKLLARSAAAAVAVLVLATFCPAQRLPRTVIPEHYRLWLTPDLKSATFTGVETIDVNLTEPSATIVVNAAEIAFQAASVTAAGRTQAATTTLDEKKEQAVFTFAGKIPAGKASLSVQYTGILNNQLRGFYLSKTPKRNYAVTQFEATDARRAFPSFDEPAFKATYDVSLTVDAADTAISNMPIAEDTAGPGAGKHTLRFATTPKISTYLVAFLVGDFQCSSGEQDGVQIRSCATPDKVALTPYSVEVAKFVLHYYNEYFGIRFPLPKLDLIALPDFEAGAMENFGAITYRETALLVDPKTASVGAEKEVALVIAHEMAHQWFGDLVTMQWWDNLWLNEGFATWMENKPVAALHPEWNIDQAVVAGLDGTLNLDALPTTHAIRARAESREEIEQMFDGISYGKASAVLLMVENFLGPETFRKGVHNYLAAHLYGNATAEDFWNAQTAASHQPVDRIMESLVAQPGVPLVTLGSPAGGRIPVSQRRFYLSPSIAPDPSQKWTLPVCFKTAAGQQCQVLSPSETSLAAPAGGIFANASGKGYYRTAYAPETYKQLVAGVETTLTPSERISLLNDEWVQVRANKATIGDYLDLTAVVKADPGAEVTGAALSGVGDAYSRLAATTEERAALAAWVRATFGPAWRSLPKPAAGDSPNLREQRAQFLGYLGLLAKDPDALAQARQISTKYMDDPSSVDATLGQTALEIAAHHGDEALFNGLQKVYETSTNPEFQAGALHLLAVFTDPALARRSLDYAVSGKVRSQDALIQVATALSIDETRDLTWQYIKGNWEKIQPLLTPELGNAVVGSTGRFCTAAERDDVKQFFAAHQVPSAERSLRHAIETIDGCIEFRALQEPNLKSWLAAHAQ